MDKLLTKIKYLMLFLHFNIDNWQL